MKLGRDGVTQLEDDQEDTTVASVEVESEVVEADVTPPVSKAEETPETPPADDAEVVVTIGEDSPASDEEDDSTAPQWVRELRVKNRELTRKNRELEAKQQQAVVTPDAVTVGEKPQMVDFDYDSEKFEQELEKWHERKRLADEATRKREEEEKVSKDAWTAKLTQYRDAKSKLKVKDADNAEAVAQEILTTVQQGIILQGADNPALLVYALGKNTKQAKELASIKDPVKFAFAVAKLETQVKATPRKAPPAEAAPPSGSASSSGTVDSQLEKLRADAERTGDHTKVLAYKRSKRQAK